MIPKQIRLLHFRQHAEKEVVFKEGMNSIAGPNGSGKSNFLQALCLCLGLDINSPGKKTDAIQDGHEKAEITLDFEHRDLQGTIRVVLKRNYPRNWEEQSLMIEAAKLKVLEQQKDPSVRVEESEYKLATFNPKETTSASMTWGEVKCRNVTEISDWMRREVGVDPKLVVSNFFPRQGDIDGAISADKAERQKVFSEKAGTALCSTVWDLLGAEIRALPDLVGAEERLAQARAAEAVATAQFNKATTEFTQASGLERDISKFHGIVAGYVKASEDRQRAGILLQEISGIQGELMKHIEDETSTKAQGVKLREEFDAIKDQREIGLQKLARAQAVAQREQQRRVLTADSSAAKQKLTEYIAATPAPPPSYDEINGLSSTIGEYLAKAKELKAWADTFATGKCPTCGSTVADEGRIAEMKKGSLEFQGKAQDLQVRKVTQEQLVKQLQAAKATWEAGIAGLRAKIAQCESTLAALPPVEAVEGPAELELLQQRIARVQELEKQLQDTRETYGRLTGLIEKKTGILEEKQKMVEALCPRGGVISPTEKDYQEATKALQEAQQNAQVYNDAQVSLGIAQGRLEDASLRLKEAQTENDRVGPLRILKGRLDRARNLFHRDALPAEVVAWYAQELVAHTETYLKMFEVNFQIIVTPELNLMAVFPDKAQPAVMLSGGEKNMLNISMRLAMADLFPSDLRVLVLDEVEVHLDPVNVAKLPILLEKVKGLARSRGLVVLFVSHHPCLRDVADHVIYANAA